MGCKDCPYFCVLFYFDIYMEEVEKCLIPALAFHIFIIYMCLVNVARFESWVRQMLLYYAISENLLGFYIPRAFRTRCPVVGQRYGYFFGCYRA